MYNRPGSFSGCVMKRLLYLSHGFIFAVTAPIIQYVLIRGEVIYESPSRLIGPLLGTLALYLILASMAMFVFRNLNIGGILASLLILAFLYLWPIFDIVLIALVVGFCLLWLVFRKPSMLYIHLIMTVSAVLLAVYYLFLFGSFLSSLPIAGYQHLDTPVASEESVPSASNNHPDIYYIILDAYGREDMLQDLYGLDNAHFIQTLEQQGFIIPTLSRSNYHRTILSLSSSLNMQYLDGVEQVLGSSSIWWPLESLIQHSQVRAFLEAQGYRTVFFATRFDATDIRDGTYYEKPYPLMLDNLDESFVGETNLDLFPQLLKNKVFFSSVDSFRKTILFDLQNLPNIADLPGPKFVFLHIISPHPPFLFDANGPITFKKNTIVSIGDGQGFGGSASDYRSGYSGQVEFLNPQVLKMIDELLARSPKKPVIIIQGDHGPGMLLNYDSAAESCIYERYSILNAYYLPGVDPSSVPADISPVDTFRFVFNHYFGTHFDYLPSRQYYAADAAPFQFQDVTSQYQPSQPTCKPPTSKAP
jgi:hypothetical protein